MKAKITGDKRAFVLTLTPETEAEKAVAKEFILVAGSSNIFGFRGYQYLNPEVEFHLQPRGRDD